MARGRGRKSKPSRKSKQTEDLQPLASKDVDLSGVLDVEGSDIAGLGGAASGGILAKLKKWRGLGASVAMYAVVQTLLSKTDKPPREDLKALLEQLKADTSTAGEVATERVGGLDRFMRQRREIASQEPVGTAPTTPILDRLGVLMPEFLTALRQRMKGAGGGLWSELADGEVLVDGASAPSRGQIAAENQQLELTLREELGFARHGSQDATRDVEALALA